MYIKNPIDKRNNFICFGATHLDNILRLKKKHYKNRTNPIIKYSSLGGVAYNIANKFSFLGLKTILISLNCSNEDKIKIKKDKIQFKSINNKILNRSYTSIINPNGEMILGLADMDNYEKQLQIKNIYKFKNKVIILDLNFSQKIIKNLIYKNAEKNIICVCGTSAHKINKIKNLLINIDILILNKQESFNLTNKKKIKEALIDIVNKNNKLTIVITNGKNSIKAYHNKNIYSCKPPEVKIKNENKAGDVMSAFFYYYFFQKLEFKTILSKSVAAGSLYVSGCTSNRKNYLKRIDKLSKKITVKSLK